MKIISEKLVVEQMIRLYCTRKHKQDAICGDCQELFNYSVERLSKCRFGDLKPNCKNCSIHCYLPEKRRRIREVMRYSAPRMLFFHPWIYIRHWLIK